MATARNNGRIIEPWSGSGWPLSLFVDQSAVTKEGIYFCARTECAERTEDGQKIRRIVREPWRLYNCERHRLCRECYDIIQQRPEDQRECDACKNEPFDDDVRTQSVQAVLPDQMVVEKRFDTTDEWQLEARDCSYNGEDVIANEQLNKQRVICPYYCGTTSRLLIGNIENHLRDCENRPPMCSFCQSYDYNEDAHDHVMRCVAKCPLNCSESSEDVNIVEHLTSEHLLGEHQDLVSTSLDESEKNGTAWNNLRALFNSLTQ